MLVRAFRGEFGHRVKWHAPQVYALGAGHTVEIEHGDEAMYPLASEYRYVDRANDDTRRIRPTRLGPEKYFTPEPYEVQGVPACDVVICPRMRNYGSAKNWAQWATLAQSLLDAGCTVFAAGAPDSSADVPCGRAWTYDRFLDASIEAMRKARLVIATASGLSLLAVMCGVPLLLITHRGLVASGPQLSADGRVLQARYGTVPLRDYAQVNHTGSRIYTIDGWSDVEYVQQEALRHV